MNTSQKIRLLVFTTVFGALWGLSEMLIGGYLHLVRFPLRSPLLAGAGAIILCAERYYTPVKGASLYTGIIALLMKFLSIGVIKLGPAAAIGIQAIIAETVFSIMGINALTTWLVPVLFCLETIPHVFAANWLLFGKGIFDTYLIIAKEFQSLFKLPENTWKIFIALWTAIHLVIGAIYGYIANTVIRYLKKT